MKLSIIPVRWLAILSFSLVVTAAAAQVRDTVNFDFSCMATESMTINGDTFVRYSLPDCEHIDHTGAPMLPVKYIRLSVPYNATDLSVIVYTSGGTSQSTERILPAPIPLTTNDTIPDVPELVIDSAIYGSNSFWPPKAAEIVGEGFYMGEHHIITLAIYPCQYNPLNDTLCRNSQVRAVVAYELGDIPANLIARFNNNLRHLEAEQAKSLVSNPHQLESFAPPAAQVQHAPMIPLPDSLMTDTIGWTYGGMLKSVESYDYMVITTRALKPAFKRLLALKRQKGYTAGAVCVEDILSNIHVSDGDRSALPDGTFSNINDDAGKIREYLKECYRYGTKFVLFAGKDVPFRSSYNTLHKTKTRHQIPTDWYFSDLDTNWNIDGDTIFGNDNLYSASGTYRFDTGAELFVGRLVASTWQEIENYINKLYRYELNPGKGHSDYLGRTLITEGYMFNTAQKVYPVYNDFMQNVTTMIQSDADDRSINGQSIIESFNSMPSGIISLQGHGDPPCIHVSGKYLSEYHYNKHYSTITSISDYLNNYRTGSSALDLMLNKYSPAILYSLACTTTPFDHYMLTDSTYFEGVSIGQSFTLGQDYGGVAFIGNTREGLVSSSSNQEKAFAEQLKMGNFKAGFAEHMSKTVFVGNKPYCYIMKVRNLIGDPEFEIRTAPSNQYSDIEITRYDNSVTVLCSSLTDDDAIALNQNDGNVRLGKVTSGGIVFENVNPNSSVMVYRHNYLPYIAPLYLQNERIEHSQYVIANDVYAGSSVDTCRSSGDLTIASGIEYEIDAKGVVTLSSGFKVEKGALFSVTKSDY